MGAPATILVGGLCTLLVAAWFSTQLPRLRVSLRPIYVAQGILADPAA